MQESALALQPLQTAPYGKVFVDLVLSYKKLLPSILQTPELELAELESVLALQPLQTCEIVVR